MNKPASLNVPIANYSARFTAREFVEMLGSGAFEGMRVELFRGELKRMNPAMSEHARLQGNAYFNLRTLLGEDGSWRAFVEIGVQIDESTILGPDVVIVDRPLRERRLLKPEDILLIVEVADETLGRDLGEKQEVYAGAGIPTYWVVDVNAHVVHVMTGPSEGEYRTREVVRFGEPLTVPGSDRTITLD